MVAPGRSVELARAARAAGAPSPGARRFSHGGRAAGASGTHLVRRAPVRAATGAPGGLSRASGYVAPRLQPLLLGVSAGRTAPSTHARAVGRARQHVGARAAPAGS